MLCSAEILKGPPYEFGGHLPGSHDSHDNHDGMIDFKLHRHT